MITLTGAYGRKYYSETAFRQDWEDGFDFKIVGGPYCSIRDIDSLEQEFGTVYFTLSDKLDLIKL